jgi:adenosylmethionine-8-amino-7-oxononanoate aminotransferase
METANPRFIDKSAIFHRQITHSYPLAVRGEGAVIIDSNGRRFLDGAGGVFVAILGHSPQEVAAAISKQAHELNFAYTGDFTTAAVERLARELLEIAPRGFSKVWLTTSGSTANETAIKLARQYHLLRGRQEKTKIISRWHSYHGSTMGALSMTGTPPRRRPYEPYLLNFPHVHPPYCYRCPLGLTYPSCSAVCAQEIEAAIGMAGAQYISAIIMEPVAGGPLGGLVTPPEYFQRARRICDESDVLLIVDEVVSGIGRTGDWFGVEQSGIVPDIITLAKGLGGGFMPIGAVLVHERVYEAFASSGTSFLHGESLTGHVLIGAAGSAVIEFIKNHDLLSYIQQLSGYLDKILRRIAELPLVGEVRGRGLLRGLELVRDKKTKEPFPRELQVAERVVEAAARQNVLLIAGNACADGINGDTVVLAPPYIITENQIDELVRVLADSIRLVAEELATRK